MSDLDPVPSFSVIVEWENVRLSEMDRCRRMLRQLAQQVPPLGSRVAGASARGVEILILYDADGFDGKEIEKIVSEEIPAGTPHCHWRVIAGGDGGYYGLKNVGATLAQGDVLVFIDCDVIPEPGWLEQLLTPMKDPACQVVGGNTFIDPQDFVARTFALTWFFPLRAESPQVAPTSKFYANSVAFRRDCFLKHPYVLIPGASRGCCRLLAKELQAAGVPMVMNTGAQASHPPPNGLRHFLMRGLAHGRDDLLLNQSPARKGKGTPFHSIARVVNWQFKGLRRVLFRFHRVKLPFWQVLPAALVATLYSFLYFVGDVATRIFPRKMKASFKL